MAICPICNQPCGLVKSHPQCEAEVAAGKKPETIRSENERSADHTSLVRSSAKALTVCAGMLVPVLILVFALAACSEGHDEMAVALFFVGAAVGGLVAAAIYNFCVLIGAAALRMSDYIEKSEK